MGLKINGIVKFSTTSSLGSEIFLDPLKTDSVHGTLSNSDQTASFSSLGSSLSVQSANSGKWYWEVTCDSGGDGWAIGVGQSGMDVNTYIGFKAFGVSYYELSGERIGPNNARVVYGPTFTVGDIIGVALDLDNGEIYFSKNGSFPVGSDPVARTGPAQTGLTGTWFAGVSDGSSSVPCTMSIQSTPATITYSAPSGYSVGLG